MNLKTNDRIAQELARQIKASKGVSDVYIPQDMDYPALQVNVNRERAAELGLSPKEVIDNLITALTSDVMIAPSYWVDPKSGNNYSSPCSTRKIRSSPSRISKRCRCDRRILNFLPI